MTKHKRLAAVLAALVMALTLAACSAAPSSDTTSSPSHSPDEVQGQLQEESLPPEDEEDTPADTEASKVLVAFFSWAYNATPFEPEDYDIDAVGQASVVVPGDVGIIAQFIEQELDADEFIITVDYKYSSDYNVCIYEHRDQRDRGEMPNLTSWVENLDDYDTIFLGFPNWNYGLPMPIRSFVAEHDLSGKTIVPFVTHGTGGLARTIQELNEILPDDCTILQEYDVYEDDVKSAQDDVIEWLESLGYESEEKV